eukprot:TRINITY_DN936_c0_g1_i2.p1 TRINITY_DN936_c0_g1~~TRINITY_DN936_c0_g1_i2.p1  ORF type:complete len:374 (-),score=87.36 TRINITY_DN936_c0_g1_i2:582-1703(-)
MRSPASALILFSALCILIALLSTPTPCSSRSIIWANELLDKTAGVTNGWAGTAFGWLTMLKGKEPFRFRLFGMHNIEGDTVTRVYLSLSNGSIVQHLQYDKSGKKYVLGETRFNETMGHKLLVEKMYLTIATSRYPNGAISGAFICSPHMGLALLSSNFDFSAASNMGIGFVNAHSTAVYGDNLPIDLVHATRDVKDGYGLHGRVVVNLENAKSANFRGPNAEVSEDGPVISKMVMETQTAHIPSTFTTTDYNSLLYDIDHAKTYLEVLAENATIRGQLYPLLVSRRKKVPYQMVLTVGTVRGKFSQVKHALLHGTNQTKGEDKKTMSFIPQDFARNGTTYKNSYFESFMNFIFPFGRRSVQEEEGRTPPCCG